jgi:4'-phosphopantetheinyl transferase EntD
MIAALFPDNVVTIEADPALIDGVLFPEEEACIRRAVPKRREEFTAGRLCARKALARFGITDFPLVTGEGRMPVWPPSVVGSISHTEGYCGVAVASTREVESVGLDVECVGRVERNLWRRIFTPHELHRIGLLSPDDQAAHATLLFSAKECFYKAQYGITRRWVGFREVQISVGPKRNVFQVVLLADVEPGFPEGIVFEGKYVLDRGYIGTGITMNAG